MDWISLYFQLKVIGAFVGIGIIAVWLLFIAIFVIKAKR
jgi:hypothetical protein